MRYGFGAPTIWVYEASFMANGAAFMLGAAYALHKGAHIRTDFFYERWSVRTKGMVDSISYLVFFFPSIVMLLIASASEAWYAYTINETSEQTPWRPILWPYKSVVPLTCIFLMVQGISETIKSVYAWRTGIVLEHKEKIEI
jgi:TRAP-type mannitol/chloroaromatic compound transport system permease small subunit